MSTDNEMWRDNSEESQDAGRDGNRYYNRDNNNNQDGYYNRDRGGDRYSRPSYNRYNNDNQSRSSYNRDGNERPRFNRENGERRPRINTGNRPQRSYNNDGNERSYNRDNNGGRYERSYNRDNNDRNSRPSYNRDNNDRNNRPSYNRDNNYNREDRPWRQNSQDGGDGPRFRRPSPNSSGGSYSNGNSYGNRSGGDMDRPRRPRFNPNPSRGGQFSGRPRPRTDGYNPNDKYSKKKQIEYKELYVDPSEPIRLNKYLANAGVCSRREADEFITAGVVSVNGEVITELGTKITRGDLVKFHDQPVSIERKVYVLLNKPKNCVTTSDDPQERRTVMDLVKNICNERIYPVGRLDRNTTGVLLLTNDGDLASKLTHPKFMKKKIYHVHLDKNLAGSDMEKITQGIELEDGEIHADAISYVGDNDKKQVGIEIHSGKNRIVRRIFESLGYRVNKLDRVYFAGLTKKNLRKGDWRFLTEQEVNFLRMGSFE